MPENFTQPVNGLPPASPVEELHREYHRVQELLEVQSPILQRFLEAQARQLANGYIERVARLRFTLPDRVICETGQEITPVPMAAREQTAGSFKDRLTGRDVHTTLRQRLSDLEQSTDCAISTSASLLRHATVIHMVRDMLPSGRTVKYIPAEGEEIPTIPASDSLEADSAITAAGDAIVENGNSEDERGNLQVPFVPAARKFYLPQWVAFDDSDNLLVNSVGEAEAHISSMQRFLTILHSAHSLAPYMLADEEYQTKRYGMLGQLINQGRALARYRTREIIHRIQIRAAEGSLNRGLSLSLPYFDDQTLEIEKHPFVIIPAGRIMFTPAFVVRAAREEQAKVTQDTRFNASTRKHLLASLKMLEDSFYTLKLSVSTGD